MNILLQKLKATYHRYPLITSLSVLILFGATITFATPPVTPYTAGETLDPSCAPGDSNCTVTVFPDQTGNSGKYLTTDGTTTSWATISGAGISSLNGLTGATQTFTTGTSGSDFSISSSGTTHTFNIPTASGSNRGLLSSSDWTTFNDKENALTFSGPLSRSTNTISITQADTNTNGYLSSTDWDTFNDKVSSPISLGTSGNTLYSSGAGGEQGNTAPGTGNNTFLGFNSGIDADNASYSTFIGSNAGVSALNAEASTFVGYNAGNGASAASGSAFFGILSGQDATNAMASVFLGSSAGYQATNADSSIFIGIAAGYNDTVNNNIGTTSSVLIGGYTNTGGYTNSVLVGSGSQGSPIANTANNQFMLADYITNVRWRGVEYTFPSAQGGAGEVLTNDGSGGLSWAAVGGASYTQINEPNAETLYLGDYNGNYNANYIGVGQGSNYGVKIHGSGVPLGYFVMQGGSPLVYIGDADNNYNNTHVGIDDALQRIYISSQELYIPADNITIRGVEYTFPSAQGGAGEVLTNDGSGGLSWAAAGATSSPISLGSSGNTLYTPGLTAGEGDTGTGNNIFLGQSTGDGAINVFNSNFLGQNAGYGATDANYSNFLGTDAGSNATGASQSNFLGRSAGLNASSAFDSNFFGYTAGSGATNASYSNFFGLAAGQDAVSASYSNFFGYGTGNQAVNASNSIMIGSFVGWNDTVDNTSGGWSILIGSCTNTGGYTNSVLIGGGSQSPDCNSAVQFASNTASNQFMLADTITNVRWSGVEYTLPSAQGGAGEVLTNDGSGGLSWAAAGGGGLNLYTENYDGTALASAFFAEMPATGDNSIGIGYYKSAEGYLGATGVQSFAMGSNATASGDRSFAFGNGGDDGTGGAVASGQFSIAIGWGSAANDGSVVLGSGTSSGEYSVSLGGTASGDFSFSAINGNAGSYREFSVGQGTPYSPVSPTSHYSLDRAVNFGYNGFDFLTILKSGLTGIGYDNFENTVSSARLQVNGAILQTQATDCSIEAHPNGEIVCVASDQKLKKDITDMSYGLSHVMQLHPVGYNFIDTKFGSGPQIGFIAQELEQIIPEVVTDGPDYKSVNYALLTSVLTKAVQELNLTLTAIDTFAFEDTGGFAERLRQFLESATNGIRKIFVKEVQTDKLCVGTTCVTESQLQQLLNQSGQSGSAPTPSPESEVTTTEEDSNSEEVVLSEGDISEEEEVVTVPSPEETPSTTPEEESTPEQIVSEPTPEPLPETVPDPVPEVVIQPEPSTPLE